MKEYFLKAKNASLKLKNSTTSERNSILKNIIETLENSKYEIMEANNIDVIEAKKYGLKSSLINRLILNEKRINAMIQGVKDILEQEDPIGIIDKGYNRPNGLTIHKVRVPLGVVGIIYESRPNVTVDAAALCIKSGNVAILRGGKEARNTNMKLGKLIKKSLKMSNFSENCIIIVDDPERTKIMEMLKAKNEIDIIVPRGGEGLIKYCTEHSLVPLVKHDKGLCHVYIDEFANFETAINVSIDAKVDRPDVCNAMETLLVHEKVAEAILPKLLNKFIALGVELRGCEKTLKYADIYPAKEEDWATEYLDMILSVKIVKSIDEAMEHINKYGSMHSESIVTESYSNANKFLDSVDAAAVYVNASTRFTDGAEFGLGAEMGISTQKLHCRGPMGAYDLTTTKYKIYGTGQTKGKH
jgi:glutamate-5-semialdehyde dehydrogenase